MELGPAWVEAGLWGLFLASFLAATILPFSSEAVLAAMAMGSWSGIELWWVASVGNTLGGLTNYAIGRWVPERKLVQRLGIDPKKAERWRSFAYRYGAWGALSCWLPVVGDPIALALGVMRVRFVPCALLMFLGKAVRYAVVLWLVRGTMGQ
jgi:membrane protein YqaA with SNARE-associated domain